MREFFKRNGILLLLLAAGAALFSFAWLNVREEYGYLVYGNYQYAYTEPLHNDAVYDITFQAPDDMALSGVMIALSCGHLTDAAGELQISVTDRTTGEFFGDGSILFAKVYEWGWQEIDFPAKQVAAGDEVAVRLTVTDFEVEDAIAIAKTLNRTTPALKLRTDRLDLLQKVTLGLSCLLLAWLIFSYLWLFRFRKRPLVILLGTIFLFVLCLLLLAPEHELYEPFFAAVRTGGLRVFTAALLAAEFSRIPLFLWILAGLTLLVGLLSYEKRLLIDDRELLHRQSVMTAAFLLLPFVTMLLAEI